MNIYDPADGICYVHMAEPAAVRAASVEAAPTCTELPPGYANQSPRTRLLRGPAHVRGTRTRAASLAA